MFRVYLDGILQDENDIININDLAEFTIIREDGFNSTEQILREKTEMQLSFGGNAYCYIHDKIKNEQCAQIDFLIEDDCGLSYNGIIPVTSSELNIFEQYGKVSIKDNSFSAYIRDYMKMEIDLYSKKTINCFDINNVDKQFTFYKTHNNNTDTSTVPAFDVVDVLNYLVAYCTDNSINVVSNYLTSNRYAITTGYNMHNTAVSVDKKYPKITIDSLFNELRKKLRLYMAIEYYPSGQPYLRIEHEEYFFSNTTPLFNLDIQPKTVQKYDTNRNFNNISVGSNNYEVNDIEYLYIKNNKTNSWISANFNSCGTCTADKENKLDLVNDYVISSNIIYEALNSGFVDYKYDESIFLFNYEIVGNNNVVKRELIGSEYVYNTSLINSEVLQNWIDYYGQCTVLSRLPKNGFKASNNGNIISVEYGVSACCNYVFTQLNTVYDENILLSNSSITHDIGGCYGTPFADINTEATIPTNGYYQFKSDLIRIRQRDIGDYNFTNVNYYLRIMVYSDNTHSSLLSTYESNSLNNMGYDYVTLNLDTGNIYLNTGNVVTILVGVDTCGNIAFHQVPFDCDLITFEMVGDGECESIDYNNQNSKPYEVELQYPLCYEDFELARQNKNGYITMANNRYWIKEINYKPKRLSTLKLIGNNSL